MSTLTEIHYIIAFCKNLSNDWLDDCVNKTVLGKMAVNILEQYLDTVTKVEDGINSFGTDEVNIYRLRCLQVFFRLAGCCVLWK